MVRDKPRSTCAITQLFPAEVRKYSSHKNEGRSRRKIEKFGHQTNSKLNAK